MVAAVVTARRRAIAVLATSALLVAGCAPDGSGSAAPSPSSVDTPAPTASGAPTPAPAATASPAPAPYGEPVVDLPGAGVHRGTLDGPDGPRTFQVHVPQGLDIGAPLLVALHPFTQDGPRFEALTGIAAEATERGIVTVLPDGLSGSWNAALTCCPPATRRGTDDVGYLRALVRGLQDQLELDPERTWAAGFSNGGFLSLRLACEASDVVTAVVSHAGTMDLPCEPERPVSVLVSHGADDQLVPFDGGRGPVSPQAAGRGARDVTAAWRQLDACPEPSTRDSVAGEEVIAVPCADDTAVGLVVWDGVGHTWPVALNALLLDWLEADAARRGAGEG